MLMMDIVKSFFLSVKIFNNIQSVILFKRKLTKLITVLVSNWLFDDSSR